MFTVIFLKGSEYFVENEDIFVKKSFFYKIIDYN